MSIIIIVVELKQARKIMEDLSNAYETASD